MMATRQSNTSEWIVETDEPVLVTGAGGFIGTRVVETLLRYGFTNLRCFVRPSTNMTALNEVLRHSGDGAKIDVVQGNLVSRDDCRRALEGATVIYHLVAGIGKSFSVWFMYAYAFRFGSVMG